MASPRRVCDAAAMDRGRRHELVRETLDGYASGPDAPIDAEINAIRRARSARLVVLVEGISDQIAFETLATRSGRNLDDEQTVVVPIGGAQAIARHLTRFGPKGAGVAVAGLCDSAEAPYYARGLATAGFDTPAGAIELERHGFFVCRDDLEQELIRACGPRWSEATLDANGDLGSFRTLQKQPAWRDRPVDDQLHRWLRAGARRNLRYARLLIEAVPFDEAPPPLRALLAATEPR